MLAWARRPSSCLGRTKMRKASAVDLSWHKPRTLLLQIWIGTRASRTPCQVSQKIEYCRGLFWLGNTGPLPSCLPARLSCYLGVAMLGASSQYTESLEVLGSILIRSSGCGSRKIVSTGSPNEVDSDHFCSTKALPSTVFALDLPLHVASTDSMTLPDHNTFMPLMFLVARRPLANSDRISCCQLHLYVARLASL